MPSMWRLSASLTLVTEATMSKPACSSWLYRSRSNREIQAITMVIAMHSGKAGSGLATFGVPDSPGVPRAV